MSLLAFVVGPGRTIRESELQDSIRTAASVGPIADSYGRGFPGVDAPAVAADDGGVGVSAGDLPDVQPHGTRQRRAVDAEPDRRAGVVRAGEDQFDRRRVAPSTGPDRDPALEVERDRRARELDPRFSRVKSEVRWWKA